MLYCTEKPIKGYIYDVDEMFDNLKFSDILPYKGYLENFDIMLKNSSFTPETTPLGQTFCKTSFGDCQMFYLAMSLKILVLARMSIDKGIPFSFYCGLLGDNFVEFLYNMCKETDLVSMYAPRLYLPYVNIPDNIREELMRSAKRA